MHTRTSHDNPLNDVRSISWNLYLLIFKITHRYKSFHSVLNEQLKRFTLQHFICEKKHHIFYFIASILILLFKRSVVINIISNISMVYEISSRRKRREGYHTIVVTRLWDQQQVSMMICTECRHISENLERYKAHLKEPRHINNYRDLAYKGKTKK